MKKVLTYALIVMLTIVLLPYQAKAAESSVLFSDVNSEHWAQKAIQYMVREGAINGYQDGSFRPEGELKRVHVAKMLDRIQYISSEFSTEELTAVKLKDVPATMDGFEAVAGLYLSHSADFLFENGQFQPYKSITRGEVAALLSNVFGIYASEDYRIDDVSPSSIFYDGVAGLVENEVTNLYNGTSFKPNNVLTRAQFAMFTARVLNDYFKPSNQNFDSDHVFYWGNFTNITKVDYENSRVYELSPFPILGEVIEKHGWIYFLEDTELSYELLDEEDNTSRGHLYRMKEDGTKTELLIDEQLTAFTIVDNKIYFSKYGDFNEEGVFEYSEKVIASMNLDGSNQKVLYNDVFAESMIPLEDSIYFNWYDFQTWESGFSTFSISSNEEPVILLEELIASDDFKVLENGIYYKLRDYDDKVFFMNHDGSNMVETTLTNIPVAYINDYVYYDNSGANSEVSLFKQSGIGTGDGEVISTHDYVHPVGVVGNYLIYLVKYEDTYYLTELK